MKWLIGVLGLVASASWAAEAKFGALVGGAEVPGFKMTTAEGKELALGDFKGRVVVVNFFATNRPPADVLENAWAQYREQDVTVLGVCTNATREEFAAWLKKHGGAATYPIGWDAGGKVRAESAAQKSAGVFVFPATIVIDREGKFVGGFVGLGGGTPAVLRGHLRAAGVKVPEEPKPAAAAPPPPREDRTLKVGEVAPDFANVDLAGKTVRLADFSGKIVVLDFWATWCGPCLASMPHTQKIAVATKEQGVVVLAACTSDTRAKFEEWIRANGTKYPDVVFANDPNGRDVPEKFAERASAKLYGVSGIPCQFVIGRDGKVADVIRGYGEGDTRLEEALRRLGVTVAP